MLVTNVIVQDGSDSSGTKPASSRVLNYYEYDAFGNPVVCEETVKNRFRYTGEQFDPVTGQYYLRARFYSPVIGRFTQEDTFEGDGLNLYSYVRNNPVKYVDPSGHYCEEHYKKLGYTEEEAKKKAVEDTKRTAEYEAVGMSHENAEMMANYDSLVQTDGVDVAEAYVREQGVTIEVGKYEDMDDKSKGQAHHLNQNAAFGKNPEVIPQDDGLCVYLKGNIMEEPDSPHYRANQVMERMYTPYRRGGEKSKEDIPLCVYNNAVYDSMKSAGMNDVDASYATARAMGDQRTYGIIGFVPRKPRKISVIKI